MSKPPGVEQILQLLERLRRATRDFEERRRALDEEIRKRNAAEHQRHRVALAALDQSVGDELQKTESAFRERNELVAARHLERKGRIREAQRMCRKAALDRIEAEEGRRKFELQRQMLRVTRERDAGLAAADQALRTFQDQLGEDERRLVELERQAHTAFGVYGRRFRGLLAEDPGAVAINADDPPESLAAHLRVVLSTIESDLVAFRRQPLTRLSGLWALWFILVLCPLPLLPVLQYFHISGFTYPQALGVSGALLVVGVAAHAVGRRLARASALQIAKESSRARGFLNTCATRLVAVHQAERARIEDVYRAATAKATEAWQNAVDMAETKRAQLPRQLEEKTARVEQHHERLHANRISRGVEDREAAMTAIGKRGEDRRLDLQAESVQRLESWNRKFEEENRSLSASSAQEDRVLRQSIAAAQESAAARFPRWTATHWALWDPPSGVADAVRFGWLNVTRRLWTGEASSEEAGEGLGPEQFSLPLLLSFPDAGSLVVEAAKSDRALALATLNQIVLRLFAASPPGRIAVTIVDPVGLGESFAGLTHLADEAGHLIQGRIWTQPTAIEERLRDLNDHMEKVIQMYLRNEFSNLAEYNEQAGNIAEKYHFLVVADFPSQFTDLALQRFQAIAAAGGRCGVFTLVHWDSNQDLPAGFSPESLWQHSARLTARPDALLVNGRLLPGAEVELEAPPDADHATAFLRRVAKASIDSNRVEVPFEQVAPQPAEIWSVDAATEVRVPIGRTGATKLQYLALGKGTRQHALIAGKTGSGKSTLLHVLITNLSLWCRPEEVEFYLVDFKKGVEFKSYATHRLPHARVVAIESDREFGLSVLQRVDEELKRRGDLFRRAAVQDIAAYRRAVSESSLPRVLLVIDEFQELFVEEDRIGQSAALLLDRIVRQGRAFGIHAVLGSQTLGGAYTVARSTLGQMVVRIALQCNEADAYLIMDDNNPAPRLLSRPGEGIYNDAAGAPEGNSPFQTVWLPDHQRDTLLRDIRHRADTAPMEYPGPMIYEGDAPADLRENGRLRALLASGKPTSIPPGLRVWLGAPNAIKGPTEAVFRRQSAANLLVVGQREESTVGMFIASLIALSAQHPRGAVQFVVLDGSPPESPGRAVLEQTVARLPHRAVLARASELEDVLRRISEEQNRANENASGLAPGGSIFLFIHRLEQFKRLRQEEEFGLGSSGDTVHPSELLKRLLAEGGGAGLHVVANVDTYGNLTRFLGRKVLADFGMRVLYQMSANDSASLIDSPAASRLGLHKALLHEEREGSLELFRPYSIPEPAWLDESLRDLP